MQANEQKQVKCYKMTFEAIQAVRKELAEADANGNTLAISEIMLRLSSLYASIDAQQFIECMQALEQQDNVIKVDFKKVA